MLTRAGNQQSVRETVERGSSFTHVLPAFTSTLKLNTDYGNKKVLVAWLVGDHLL
jgi:hypothetical protein